MAQNSNSNKKPSKLPTLTRPRGCDTFVAFPPATPEGIILFGKNSDRPQGEGQSIKRYPRITHFDSTAASTDNTPQCQCTYISIPQVATTHAVLLSQIDWMWGAEMGANEHGVCIGNEAVWTQDVTSGDPLYLLGMDLVRLGLERATTAREALEVITTLLEKHGQGGACHEDDPSFTYHNSYMIVDPTQAWVLETSGRHWCAQKITTGVRNMSNCLSIRTEYDLTSKGMEEYARQKGYWKKHDNDSSDSEHDESESSHSHSHSLSTLGPFDFTQAFCMGDAEEETSDPRFCGGTKLLNRYASKGTMSKENMFSILRDHKSGICMHGGFETTSSMVSEIRMTTTATENGNSTSNGDAVSSSKDVVVRHWMTGKPHPCKNDFEEQDLFQEGTPKSRF